MRWVARRHARIISLKSWALPFGVVLLLLHFWGPVMADTGEVNVTDLKDLSLADLLSLQVTTLSKKEEPMHRAAAAVFVLSGEEIRRSGVSSIPEALRLVPGLQVAKLDANKWAITARGFLGGDHFGDKLLVLMDGRILYSALFAGVFWDVQDTMLADIDRIEVIRGPGATVWGANAVNGVINIITKRAGDTQGTHLSLRAGNEDEAIATLRHGGALGDAGHWRAYGKFTKRDAGYLPPDEQGDDEAQIGRMGFRLEWNPAERNEITLQGDYYDGDAGQTTRLFESPGDPAPTVRSGDSSLSGGNILGRWSVDTLDGQNISLQSYYDRTNREELTFSEERDVFDVEYQHLFKAGARNELTWSLGYRLNRSEILEDSFTNTFLRKERSDNLFSGFLQDEIEILPDELALWIGSKFEHNDYTGWEVQPSVRSSWQVNASNVLWGALSRAVRTTAQWEEDVRSNGSVIPDPTRPILISIVPNEGIGSEELLAFEVGYRFLREGKGSVDLATFYNRYEDVSTFEEQPLVPEDDPPPPHDLIPLEVDRRASGYTYGAEISTNWQLTSIWRATAAYSFLQMHIREDESSNDTGTEERWDDVPTHQVQMTSRLDLPHGLQFDANLMAVGELPTTEIDGYVRVDLRLGWKPDRLRGLDLSVGVQNLFDEHHPEYISPGFVGTEAERAFWAQLAFDF